MDTSWFPGILDRLAGRRVPLRYGTPHLGAARKLFEHAILHLQDGAPHLRAGILHLADARKLFERAILHLQDGAPRLRAGIPHLADDAPHLADAKKLLENAILHLRADAPHLADATRRLANGIPLDAGGSFSFTGKLVAIPWRANTTSS